MPLLTVLLIAIGPFLVFAPGALLTAWQIPECWRPAGTSRPVARPRPARTAVAW